jgi:hypothetical protein
MKWSVGIEAEGDRVLSREEIVELADAVAASDGIATGVGTSRYGAQLIVDADSRQEAVGAATRVFRQAAATAGLPPAPVVRAEAMSEAEDAAIGQAEDAAIGQGEDAAIGQGEDAAISQGEDAAMSQGEDAAP